MNGQVEDVALPLSTDCILTESRTLEMIAGIVYGSIENVSESLDIEISIHFGWDFDAAVTHQQSTWDRRFTRVKPSATTPGKGVFLYQYVPCLGQHKYFFRCRWELERCG